jgi:hypothetical protein
VEARGLYGGPLHCGLAATSDLSQGQPYDAGMSRRADPKKLYIAHRAGIPNTVVYVTGGAPQWAAGSAAAEETKAWISGVSLA